MHGTWINLNSFLKFLWHVFGRSAAFKCCSEHARTFRSLITFVSCECLLLSSLDTRCGMWEQGAEKTNLTYETSNMRIKINVYHIIIMGAIHLILLRRLNQGRQNGRGEMKSTYNILVSTKFKKKSTWKAETHNGWQFKRMLRILQCGVCALRLL